MTAGRERVSGRVFLPPVLRLQRPGNAEPAAGGVPTKTQASRAVEAAVSSRPSRVFCRAESPRGEANRGRDMFCFPRPGVLVSPRGIGTTIRKKQCLADNRRDEFFGRFGGILLESRGFMCHNAPRSEKRVSDEAPGHTESLKNYNA
jgi:hypothetical protein